VKTEGQGLTRVSSCLVYGTPLKVVIVRD